MGEMEPRHPVLEDDPKLGAFLDPPENGHNDGSSGAADSLSYGTSNATPGFSSNDPAQDLESILAQLSQYSAAQQQARQAENASEELRQLQQLQELPIQHRQPPPAPIAQSVSVNKSLDPRLNRNQTLTPPVQGPKTAVIDPATILEWPQALRCVTKLSAQNPNMAIVVKGMIIDQERNVQQWFDDRKALLVKQAGRIQAIKELNETIKSIGGVPAVPPTPEEDQAERDTFDMKVYKASQQMHNHYESELKKLGVPFFGVSPSLIIANELQQTNAARDPLSKAMITRDELAGSQKKMIQYLEDLYRD